MTAGEDESTVRAGTGPLGRLPGRRRLVLSALGALFWGWLLANWVYYNSALDRALSVVGLGGVLRPDVNVRDREPFVPPEPFEAVRDTLDSAAVAAGPLGLPFEWLAGVFDLAAFATTTMPELAAGAWLTVLLTVSSLLLGLSVAVPLAVARTYGGRAIESLALGYTELIRGTPLLAQLFVLFFGLPLQGFFDGLPGVGGPLPGAPVLVAIVGFTVNSSAYQAEYIRAALESVDPGQLTAARAVGLSKLQGIRYVVLPQGLRFAIPGWSNEFIYLIKYSSLAAFITVPELFRRARNIGSDTFHFTEIYLVAAVFYLAMVLTTTVAMTSLEDRVSIPGLGQSGGRG